MPVYIWIFSKKARADWVIKTHITILSRQITGQIHGLLSQIVYSFVYYNRTNDIWLIKFTTYRIMNLKDYFHQQKEIHMSDTDKLNLYQDFMLKDMKSHFARKRSFLHIKSFVYSIVVMFFLFSFYGVYFFTDRYNEYEGLIMNPDNSVQASYIAKVVDFNGSFYIEHAGKRVQTSNIQNGDIITLKENTQLVCQINAWTKAKLIWPAQFSVEQVSAGKTPQYKLNIIKGDFVEMKSTKTTPSEKIQLTMKDEDPSKGTITVQQANWAPIDYQLIKSWEQHIVKNNWWSLSITTMDKDNKQTSTKLNNEQVLAIGNNDIKLFANMKKFADAIKTNDISQTFTFNSSKEIISTTSETGAGDDWDEETPKEVQLASLLNTSDEKVDQAVSSQLWSLFSDSKQIISPEQTQVLRTVVNKDFILSDMWDMYKSMLKWQDKELSLAYSNIERKIAQLHEQFKISYIKPSWSIISENLLQLKTKLTSFNSTIKNKYTLPEKYLTNLNTFANRLEYIAGLPANTAGQKLWWDELNADENRSNLLQALPAKLRF